MKPAGRLSVALLGVLWGCSAPGRPPSNGAARAGVVSTQKAAVVANLGTPAPPLALHSDEASAALWLSSPSGLAICGTQHPELARTRLVLGTEVPLRFEQREFLENWLLVTVPVLQRTSLTCPSDALCLEVPHPAAREALERLIQCWAKPDPATVDQARALSLQHLVKIENGEPSESEALLALLGTAPLDSTAPWGSAYFRSLTRAASLELLARLSRRMSLVVSGPRAAEDVASQAAAHPVESTQAAAAPAAPSAPSAPAPRLFWLARDRGEQARAELNFAASSSASALRAALDIIVLRLETTARQASTRLERRGSALVLNGPAHALPALVHRIDQEALGLVGTVGAPTVQELALVGARGDCAPPRLSAQELQRAMKQSTRRTVLLGAQDALEAAFGSKVPLTLVEPKTHQLLAAPHSRPVSRQAEESPEY